MQKNKVLLVFLLLLPLQALAVELEDTPDKDVGDIDRAAEAFSVEDIKLVKLVGEFRGSFQAVLRLGYRSKERAVN